MLQRSLALLVFCVVVAPWSAGATPYDTMDASPGAAGFGGAQVSAGEGAAAIYYNPAAITRGEWIISVEAGYYFAGVDVNLDVNGDNSFINSDPDLQRRAEALRERAREIETISGYHLGIAFHIGRNAALGLYTTFPQHRIARNRSYEVDEPFFLSYDNRPQRMMVLPAIALAFGEEYRFGFGVAWSLLTDLSGSSLSIVPPGSDETVTIRDETEISLAGDWLAGVHFEAQRRWGIGLSFRDAQDLTANGRDVVAVTVNGSTADVPVRFKSVGLYAPLTVQLGGHYRFGPYTIAADLAWRQWSEYRPPYPVVAYDFPPGTALPNIPGVFDREHPLVKAGWDFKDTWVPAFGFEYRWDLAWAMRIGYRFEASPTPNQEAITSIIAGDTHTASLAFTFSQPESIGFEVALTYQRMQEVGITKDPALLPDESAAPGRQTSNVGSPSLSATAEVYGASLLFTFR